MRWKVEFTPRSRKDLQRLSIQDQRRIVNFLSQRVSAHPDPRALAKRLAATDEELWRFRVGDYRLMVQFHEGRLTILVIAIGNRRDIYR